MTKNELVESIAASVGIPKSQVNSVLDELIGTWTKELKKGESVTVTGFGTFKPTKRAARVGRNPQTGDALKIAASKSVRFAPGATLKATLNPKKR